MNPYCMRCGEHLGMPFHETNEHDEALALENHRLQPDVDASIGQVRT